MTAELPLITPNILSRAVSICLPHSRARDFQFHYEMCLMDWKHVLEMLSFCGVSVERELARINGGLQGSGLSISLSSLEEKRSCLSTIDQFIEGYNLLTEFEAELKAVDAIPKINRTNI